MNPAIPCLTEHEQHELLELVRLIEDDPSNQQSVERLQLLVLGRQNGRRAYIRAMSLISALHWSFIHAEMPAPAPAPCSPSRPLSTGLYSRFSSGLQTAWVAVPLVALLFYGTFALLAWNLLPGRPARNADNMATGIAQILSASDVEWSADSAPSSGQHQVQPGDSLAIDSGILELRLSQGAMLTIEGPAKWSITGDNAAVLTHGKLIAKVPTQAVGFTLETPTTRIVDLGTEFAAEILPSGETEVQVLAGKVEFTATTGDLAAQRLDAGQAARIAVDGRCISVTPDPGRLMRLTGATDKPARPPTEEAELQAIHLHCLFDDLATASLSAAMKTDTLGATPEIDDLGVERALYAGEPSKHISRRVEFDLSNLGWQNLRLADATCASGDWCARANSDVRFGGLQALGRRIALAGGRKESGIGAHANALLTFDLDELRSAGKLDRQEFYFVCDRAGINDTAFGEPAASIHMAAIVSDDQAVHTVVVDGQPVAFEQHSGVWRVTSALPNPLTANGDFVRFHLPIAATSRYLTLIVTSAGNGHVMDHGVWIDARLETTSPSATDARESSSPNSPVINSSKD